MDPLTLSKIAWQNPGPQYQLLAATSDPQPAVVQPTAITIHPVAKSDAKQIALEVGAFAGVGLFLWWMLWRQK
ncbi:MAG: hypothetical protein IVW51_11120 [Thermaceae bacterium]|nr:hypothetical protein [Thermaceae bacterium]